MTPKKWKKSKLDYILTAISSGSPWGPWRFRLFPKRSTYDFPQNEYSVEQLADVEEEISNREKLRIETISPLRKIRRS